MTSDQLEPPADDQGSPRLPSQEDPSELHPQPSEDSTETFLSQPGVPPDPSNDPVLETQQTVISKRPRRSTGEYPTAATPTELGEILEGKRLDYFQLEEFVGGGGMGAVFRAIDTKLGRTVAVKVLSPYQTDEANLKRFKNEAQSAARLDHANIARVYYVGEDDGWYFIVFEFIEGVNLRDLVNHKGPLSIHEALTYTLQAAAALDHSAQRDLVHRDIKPSNVLVTPDGQAKLVDMGLARLHHMETNSADLTASGVTLGTFDYISPEQARDPRNADVRSDLYSLGCTLYFMLTGMPPFPGGTVLQKLLSHSSDKPAELRSFRNDLEDELLEIVDRMLAKQPADRYQTPAELIVDLSALAGKLGMTDHVPAMGHWVESRRRQENWIERHLPWAVPLVALVLVVLVLDLVTQSRANLTIIEPRFREEPFQQAAAKPASQPTTEESHDPPTTPADLDDPGSASVEENPPQTTPSTSSPNDSEAPRGSNESPSTNGKAATDANPSNPATIKTNDVTTVNSADPNNEDPSATALDDASKLLPTTVVVQGGADSLTPQTLTAGSLAVALKMVHQEPSITVIEIAKSGTMEVNPFLLRLDSSPGRQLTIRAAEGVSPLLVFRPNDFDLETSSPTMIQLIGGNLTLQNLHLRLELPDEFRPSWKLFALQDIERLRLENASLTVTRQAAANREHPLSGVAFFDFLPSQIAPSNDNEDSSEQMPTPVPQLVLQDFLARGPATLIRTTEAIPFKLRWNNGLLLTNERLLETVGSETKPRWQDGVIDLELQHVTAAVGQGLCLMKGSERRPYAVEVMANCLNCIVITDAAAPLYLQRGFTREEGIVLRPKITGSSNYYQNTDLVLKVEPRDLAAENQLFTFEYIQTNRNSKSIRPWYDEMNYRPGTMLSWRQPQVPPLELPLPQQTMDHYVLNEEDSSFDMEPPGVIAAQLPTIPAPSVQPLPTPFVEVPVKSAADSPSPNDPGTP